MKKLVTCIFFCATLYGHSQDIYHDSLKNHIRAYVENHEVVTGEDKQFFRFFDIDKKYRIKATFKAATGSKWFNMETSGAVKKAFRIYGILYFSVNDTEVTLNIYQSQNLMNSLEYQDHLFLPFTDLSSGEQTYAAGRYIDLNVPDIKNNEVVIDFNKAYNPYCAYVSGRYNCPIPPKENQLPVAILAGEKIFQKDH